MGEHLTLGNKKTGHTSLNRYCLQSWDKVLNILPDDEESQDEGKNFFFVRIDKMVYIIQTCGAPLSLKILLITQNNLDMT